MRGWVGWRQQKPRGLFGTDGMTAWGGGWRAGEDSDPRIHPSEKPDRQVTRRSGGRAYATCGQSRFMKWFNKQMISRTPKWRAVGSWVVL